jgi:hypothetical protein
MQTGNRRERYRLKCPESPGPDLTREETSRFAHPDAVAYVKMLSLKLVKTPLHQVEPS